MGRPVPESAREPELGAEDVFFLRAFLDLQHDKTQFRSIPWSAIDGYARRYDLSPGLFERLRESIFECNDALEKVFEERRKVEAARQENASGKR